MHGECLKLKAADYRLDEWLCAAARPGLVLSSGDEDSEAEEEEIAGHSTNGRARRGTRKKKKTTRVTAADIFMEDLNNHSPSSRQSRIPSSTLPPPDSPSLTPPAQPHDVLCMCGDCSRAEITITQNLPGHSPSDRPTPPPPGTPPPSSPHSTHAALLPQDTEDKGPTILIPQQQHHEPPTQSDHNPSQHEQPPHPTVDHGYSAGLCGGQQSVRQGRHMGTGSQHSQGATQHSQEVTVPPRHELPTLEEVHTSEIQTLTWIPKSARGDYSRVTAELYNKVVNNRQKISAWSPFLMFPKCVLYTMPEKNKKDSKTLTKLIKERLARWRRGGEYMRLWQEAVQNTRSRPKSKKKAADSEPSLEERNATRATRLAQQGKYTRAVQSLLSAGLAQHNITNVRQMQAKHPPAARPSTFQPQHLDTPQLNFTADQAMKGIMSFRKGSAPGPTGLRAEHLMAAIQSAPPNRRAKALEAVTRLVNVLSDGDVPEEVAPYLSGARLQAGIKKCGGLRPIAVGNLFRRLTSKCQMSAVAEKAARLLSPEQLGFGVPGGLEAVIHAVTQVVEECDDQLMILQLDLVNALNMCDRDSAFKVMEELFPDILKWVLTCYGTNAVLVFGSTIILSGFHQGDPLASLLFALTLQPIIHMIARVVPNLLANEWYLDDGMVAGKGEELQKVVDIVLQFGPARGLYLSTANTVSPPDRAKSTVWCPHSTTNQPDPLERGIPRVEEEGIILLGCPIASHRFVTEAINQRISKIETITDKLPLLKDPQVEYVLLRSCLSLRKVMYTLRTTDPTNHQLCWQ